MPFQFDFDLNVSVISLGNYLVTQSNENLKLPSRRQNVVHPLHKPCLVLPGQSVNILSLIRNRMTLLSSSPPAKFSFNYDKVYLIGF